MTSLPCDDQDYFTYNIKPPMPYMQYYAAFHPSPMELRVDEAIQKFELSHGFDSNTMLERFNSGELEETADICEWLILLKLRERVSPTKTDSTRLKIPTDLLDTLDNIATPPSSEWLDQENNYG